MLLPATSYNLRRTSFINAVRIGVISGFFLLVGALPAFGQGLTLTAAPSPISADYVTIGLIATRLVLGIILGIAGIIGAFHGYRWYTHEGNMKKAYDNKETLAKALIVASAMFIALSIFHHFVPDYSALSL